MDRFKGRYRIPSARWPAWDYGSNGAYFVTICTAGRAHYFGRIVGGRMELSALGQAAADCWRAIPEHFPFVRPDAYVVMPNHVHGIVVIDRPEPPPPRSPGLPRNRFGPQSQNLASIVRGYKVGVTSYARANALPFAWQPRYHDRVIRDDRQRERVRRYIAANPLRWERDRFQRGR